MSDSRICEHCRKPLVRRAGEERRKFLSRRFCDIKCSAQKTARLNAKRVRPTVLKNCLYCRKTIVPHPKDGLTQYAKRKFCSTGCASRFHAEGLHHPQVRFVPAAWPAGAVFTNDPLAAFDYGSPGPRIIGHIHYGAPLSEVGSQLRCFG